MGFSPPTHMPLRTQPIGLLNSKVVSLCSSTSSLSSSSAVSDKSLGKGASGAGDFQHIKGLSAA